MSKLIYEDKTNPIPVVERSTSGSAEDFNEIKASVNEVYDNAYVSVSNPLEKIYVSGDAATEGSQRFVSDGNDVTLETIVSGAGESSSLKVSAVITDPTAPASSYLEGQISYDPSTKGHLLDTGYPDVRVNAGKEVLVEVFNDTLSTINNGDPCSITGFETGGIPHVELTTSAVAFSVLGFIGVATMNILPGQTGIATRHGLVHDINSGALAIGPVYVTETGGYTQVRPRFPLFRLIVGGIVQVGTTDGILSVDPQHISRRAASRSYTFSSSDALAGTHWRAGFYDWAATSIALNQGSLSVTHGAANLTRAAHVGIVPLAAGVVDTGQVGLQVTGTLDSETGPQTAAQTQVITDDITTLTANEMAETVGKFSGNVTISLYTVSGTPTAYSISLNYGYSKYEDFANVDGTVVAFSAVWEAGAVDSAFDISLKLHSKTGWVYAATGFEPGNGVICNRLTDQQINSNLAAGEEGSYKRTGLAQFVSSATSEGIIIKIVTGSNSSIRTMDMGVTAYSEELD